MVSNQKARRPWVAPRHGPCQGFPLDAAKQIRVERVEAWTRDAPGDLLAVGIIALVALPFLLRCTVVSGSALHCGKE